MRKAAWILYILLMSSCAWFEKETTTIDLIGDIKIFAQGEGISNGLSISYFKNDSEWKPIINDCQTISFDSINRIVYVKSQIFKDEFKYEVIKFNDSINQNYFEVIDISKNEFLLNLNNCIQCKPYQYSEFY